MAQKVRRGNEEVQGLRPKKGASPPSFLGACTKIIVLVQGALPQKGARRPQTLLAFLQRKKDRQSDLLPAPAKFFCKASSKASTTKAPHLNHERRCLFLFYHVRFAHIPAVTQETRVSIPRRGIFFCIPFDARAVAISITESRFARQTAGGRLRSLRSHHVHLRSTAKMLATQV